MNSKTVLLVEDDPGVMQVNHMSLELMGYRVLEADTLARGRELVEREKPDLIVLDIKLPDGNGLEYCRELRGNNNVSILFLSAELYEKLWGMDALEDVRTVWAYVSRIRQKLGENALVDIVSEKGKGYRLIIKN